MHQTLWKKIMTGVGSRFAPFPLACHPNVQFRVLVTIGLVFLPLTAGEFSFPPVSDRGFEWMSITEEAVRILLAPLAGRCDLHFVVDGESVVESVAVGRFRVLLPEFGVDDQSFYRVMHIMDEGVGLRFRKRKCTAFVAFVYGNSAMKLFYIRNLIAKTDSMRLLLLTNESQTFLSAFRHIKGVGILDTEGLLFHYHRLPSFTWRTKDLKAPGAAKHLSRLQSDFLKDFKIRDLGSATLTTSSLSFYFPFTSWTTLENGTQIQTGLEHRILRELQKHLGFHLEHRLPLDGTWGGISPNGTYIDGIVGDVFYGRADVAFADLYFIYDRSQALDMIVYDYECTVIAVPWPDLPSWLTLIYIFEYRVWIVLGFVFFVVIVANRFVLCRASEFGAKPLSTLEVIAVLHTRQIPKNFNVYSASTKVFITVVSFFALILSINYTSGQLSQFTVIKKMRPISSFEELASSRFPVLRSGMLDISLNNEAGKRFQALNSWGLKQYPMPDEALAYVARGDSAYFDSGTVLKLYQFLKFTDSRGRSPVFIPEECVQGYLVGFVIPRHAYFKDLLKRAISGLQEGSLIPQWWKELLEEERKAKLEEIEITQEAAKPPRTLKLMQLACAFMSLLCGYAFSLLAFIFEILLAKMKKGNALH
ncbi:unnamed protein product [Darwinula stevensoni]|uniref:Ionotropic glutamate receptor L-glutamate and glycine-binding domain-containing protein n=1 Tax=Darwinula stevensoni TaxID=69355 RepID=A0A7R9FQU3_9CRUS|nr:unnamed protein product [Darwinula stevensoni]CAG0900062.1 unnamed protein product [Darwinula stevensoni]